MTAPTPILPGRPRNPRRGWRAVLTGIAAVALVATATVVAVEAAEPQRVSGLPRAAGGASAAPERDAPHEPERVAEFSPGRLPKAYGRPSSPDPTMMELWGATGYVAFTTAEIVHVTAFDLADGAVAWQRELDLNARLGALSMTATAEGLLFVINFPRLAQFAISLDLESGEDLWHASSVPTTVTGVAGDRLLIFNSDTDQVTAHRLDDATKPAEWTIAADGGRVTEVFQETEETRRKPRDDDDFARTFGFGPNPDPGQYVVFAAMYSGALSVRELSTGAVRSEGNAGEKMTDVVYFEDTVYVHRQTPRTLAAYAASDLSSPKWSVETPVSRDGSFLTVCAAELLCLRTVGEQADPLHAFDADTGELRWQTDEYRSATPVMAGEMVAVSHKGGTAVLDPESGDVVTEFDTPSFALPGDGVLIGFHDSRIRMSRPGEREPTSLGEVPDEAMTAGECEWTGEVVLCAGEENYRLWRYRG